LQSMLLQKQLPPGHEQLLPVHWTGTPEGPGDEPHARMHSTRTVTPE